MLNNLKAAIMPTSLCFATLLSLSAFTADANASNDPAICDIGNSQISVQVAENDGFVSLLSKQWDSAVPDGLTFTISKVKEGDLSAVATLVIDGKGVTNCQFSTPLIGSNIKIGMETYIKSPTERVTLNLLVAPQSSESGKGMTLLAAPKVGFGGKSSQMLITVNQE